MAEYSEDQIAEMQQLFRLCDSRGDGKIAASRIVYALRVLGLNPTAEDVKKATASLRLTPYTRISFEVFLPIYQAISEACSGDTADVLIEGLRQLDKDGAGFVSSAELRHLLSTLGEKLNGKEMEQVLKELEDSQGNIDYEKFVHRILQSSSPPPPPYATRHPPSVTRPARF